MLLGVIGGGTVHHFRVLSEVLYCPVFSNWQLVQVLVEACHPVSSQDAHRHPEMVPSA